MDAAGTRTTLHTFLATAVSRNDGSPFGLLFEGADGVVYGTTHTSCIVCDPLFPLPPGQIFRIGPGDLFARLAFAPGIRAGVIQARDGRLYGVTGDPSANIVGRVFRVEANGTLTTLHAFGINENPVGELVEIDDGSLYGATVGGTAPVSGTIFQVDPATGACHRGVRDPP
jgi:uncharacterized repeat protein (TIGR03803 family)